MGYRYIDMTTYKRKSHFEYFKELANPYVGVTVNYCGKKAGLKNFFIKSSNLFHGKAV